VGELLLLTNNPLLLEEPGNTPVRPVPVRGLPAVLRAALELVQSGYRLLSTPLPPNVPLIRAPYRSLLLERQDRQYDVRGIMALEKAGRTAASLGSSTYGEGPALDSAFIDREILLRTFRECGYTDD
jgi:hypothetical protein